ncbi:MAG TPA: molybdopterin converting factor subunit 1 [Deltaproteobacteria bacterium]|nr:molybdopterin converting factor subunit 1 [Deltaproteobacteria bacterium]
MIKVRFFANLRDLAGCETAQVDLAGVTAARLREALAEQFPALAQALGSPSVKLAVNQEFAGDDTVIADGDEVALLPPFSGG